MASWDSLCQHILQEIARRINNINDYKIFRRVCTAWRDAAAMEDFTFLRDPFLLLPQRNDGPPEIDLFDLSTEKIHRIDLDLVDTNDKKFLSSKGFLLSVSRNYDVEIVHPYSRTCIQLPSIKPLVAEEMGCLPYHRFIRKFLLSSDPLIESDCVAIIMIRSERDLYYAKSGDQSWTIMNKGTNLDISLYKGVFYSVDYGSKTGVIESCDIVTSSVTSLIQFSVPSIPSPISSRKIYAKLYYIVNCAEELLLIARYVEEDEDIEEVEDISDQYRTIRFMVFKIDLERRILMAVEDLGDNVIFVGGNSAFSIEGRLTTCNLNSIYFTDDYWNEISTSKIGGKDIGIYSLTDRSIRFHYRDISSHHVSSSLWVERNLMDRK